MAISERVKGGRLHRIHRGVYAVGHRAPSWHGRWVAAVLACGDCAVLSHHFAAALWKLLKPIDGPTHVSVPTTDGSGIVAASTCTVVPLSSRLQRRLPRPPT
jgi:hypothetical protein